MPTTRPLSVLRRAGAAALLLTAGAAAPVYKPDTVSCHPHLRPAHTYQANRQTFTTDDVGRPVEARADQLVDRSAPRGGCQGTVGNWGGEGDWNGGHLIAASFNGVSMRYNLVPMRGRQINQGLMKRVEDGARNCLERTGPVRDYRVRLRYPDRTTLVPDHIEISLSPKGAPRQAAFAFPNRTLTAKDLRERQDGITRTFQEARCGSDRP
ncbi:DNA/RNA non-specific endonuclease [Nonomuraea sp. NPDC050404]|uniref:DNA/RNA non-specific endonuclease n=1 Tax=Nonomuraea sp. NPDC050404 TaxID=3155783 RepID=UPI0033E59E46